MTLIRPTLICALLALAAVSPRGSVLAQDPAPKPALELVPQDPAEAPPLTSEETPAAVRPPPVLDFTKSFDHAAYEAALGAIAEAFPDLMRVRSLGQSRGGRDLWLAVLADTGAEEPRDHPAGIVVTDLAFHPSGEVAGPEAALFVLESLLVRARDDPQLRERFRRSALYFLPAPDPDHAFQASPALATPRETAEGSEVALDGQTAPSATPREVRLEENFPARWLPFGPDVRAPGPYALSEPESLTLARFLLERENLSTLLVLARGDEGPGSTRAPSPGSLRAYGREILDLALREARPWTGEPKSTDIGSAPGGFETAAALALSVLDGLPHLACGPLEIERLRPDLWLLDLPLENEGLLPTLGGDSRRPGIPSVSMQVSGGRVVACALREPRSESYRALHEGLEIVPIGHLDGRGALGVRIVIQAEEGAELSVSFSSSRAGTTLVGAALE